MSRRRFTKSVIASLPALHTFESGRVSSQSRTQRRPSLTDVEGILVGHYTYTTRPTGCTVITSEAAFTAGVDVRGGAPGTRETDLLRPENSVERIHAVVLSGGSAFGLDTATGVVKFLEEQGRGFDVGVAKIPIVCSAILIDLWVGDAKIRPDAAAGYPAARAAAAAPPAEGNVGAGAGGTVGKLLGRERAMKGGTGTWSIRRSDGLVVGALVAVNCAGDVVDPSGNIVAGARTVDGKGFADAMKLVRAGHDPGVRFSDNTTLAVVATNAALTKAQCLKVAQMAQDGLARAIVPAHTPWDGDTVFAVSTARWRPRREGVEVPLLVGTLAADVLETAIVRAVQAAESYGPIPAARDFKPK